VSVCDFDWVPTGEEKPGLGQLVARVVDEERKVEVRERQCEWELSSEELPESLGG
jgi:hypothetical protein